MKKTLLLFLALLGALSRLFAQNNNETLRLFLPTEYKWKIASDQESGNARMMELVPGTETLHNWSIIVTTVSMKGARNMPLTTIMNTIYNKTRVNAPQSKLMMIERKENVPNPWIIFRISPGMGKIRNPESQLYFVTQGRQNLYNNFVAVKKQMLGPLFIDQWTRVFKNSKLIYK
ncbi:hypothetical protein [Mucilaginibacter sp. CSA2-8R]|uniref:hypothetical protein n=1 Tax=Mucilaginibacter sp. CSA2-8R TaxID=3141542 RepID=UPI00315C9B94